MGRVGSTRNRLLGHPKSGSSWGKTLRAHRAIRLERKLGRRKLSWKVESKFCWGSKGLRREGGPVGAAGGRRAQATGQGAGVRGGVRARRQPGGGGGGGLQIPPAPGSRDRTGQGTPWRGAPSRC